MPGARVEAARKLIEEIEGKMTLFINSDFDRLERRIVESKDQIACMQTELEMLKNAETRERFDKCRRDLEELRRTVDKLRRLSTVSEEGLESWKQLDFERNRINAELKHADEQHAGNNDRLQQINKDYAHVKARGC